MVCRRSEVAATEKMLREKEQIITELMEEGWLLSPLVESLCALLLRFWERCEVLC